MKFSSKILEFSQISKFEKIKIYKQAIFKIYPTNIIFQHPYHFDRFHPVGSKRNESKIHKGFYFYTPTPKICVFLWNPWTLASGSPQAFLRPNWARCGLFRSFEAPKRSTQRYPLKFQQSSQKHTSKCFLDAKFAFATCFQGLACYFAPKWTFQTFF